jgi:hypothetical protein
MNLKKYTKAFKKVPSFWWDFNRDTTEIIVESDDDKFPVIARYKIKGKYADKEIEMAEKYIEDLKAGRKTPKQIKETK